jgi:hypothetical protein
MRREELYLADLIDNARAVRGYLDGVTRERWDAEDMLRDAVLYRMLLLGEIASALPDELRDSYWPKATSRNPYQIQGQHPCAITATRTMSPRTGTFCHLPY